jgi:CheY-like chemotaxis protein
MDSQKRSALVVDNENGFHEILRLVLEPLGFDVHSAFDGVQGLQDFTSRDYDVVLSDVHMPKMQGPELFAHIRRLKPTQPVVMMTSGSDPEGRFELGIQDKKGTDTVCIYKPFEIDEVVQALETVLKMKLESAV